MSKITGLEGVFPDIKEIIRKYPFLRQSVSEAFKDFPKQDDPDRPEVVQYDRDRINEFCELLQNNGQGYVYNILACDVSMDTDGKVIIVETPDDQSRDYLYHSINTTSLIEQRIKEETGLSLGLFSACRDQLKQLKPEDFMSSIGDHWLAKAFPESELAELPFDVLERFLKSAGIHEAVSNLEVAATVHLSEFMADRAPDE